MYLEEFRSDLTKAIDTHLKSSFKELTNITRTYILVDKIGIGRKAFAIRCPGLTIGTIYFSGEYPNDMIITKVTIDAPHRTMKMFYNNTIQNFNCDEWIGKKLSIEERVEDD